MHSQNQALNAACAWKHGVVSALPLLKGLEEARDFMHKVESSATSHPIETPVPISSPPPLVHKSKANNPFARPTATVATEVQVVAGAPTHINDSASANTTTPSAIPKKTNPFAKSVTNSNNPFLKSKPSNTSTVSTDSDSKPNDTSSTGSTDSDSTPNDTSSTVSNADIKNNESVTLANGLTVVDEGVEEDGNKQSVVISTGELVKEVVEEADSDQIVKESVSDEPVKEFEVVSTGGSVEKSIVSKVDKDSLVSPEAVVNVEEITMKELDKVSGGENEGDVPVSDKQCECE